MLVQFGNTWIKKFWLSSEFFSSSYFQIGQHVVLLHILIYAYFLVLEYASCYENTQSLIRLHFNLSKSNFISKLQTYSIFVRYNKVNISN